jgi:gluconokinase
MKSVPRSAYDETLGMIYFARMLDKIRLHAAGNLREDFQENLGEGMDGRCVKFLRVGYDQLKERVLAGGTDEEILHWCFSTGRELDDNDLLIWNDHMKKRAWRDAASESLTQRKKEAGLEHRDDIVTMLEFMEVDEGRKP